MKFKRGRGYLCSTWQPTSTNLRLGHARSSSTVILKRLKTPRTSLCSRKSDIGIATHGSCLHLNPKRINIRLMRFCFRRGIFRQSHLLANSVTLGWWWGVFPSRLLPRDQSGRTFRVNWPIMNELGFWLACSASSPIYSASSPISSPSSSISSASSPVSDPSKFSAVGEVSAKTSLSFSLSLYGFSND